MKLLSFSIPANKENVGFRSLKPGFNMIFHTLNNSATMEKFNPFCFAGLNGSGKSNVLEALANIFYHLEVCSARFLPASLRNEKNFRRYECAVDVFNLQYLIGFKDEPISTIKDMIKVTISKEWEEEPKMEIKRYPFDNTVKSESIPFTSGIEQDAPTKAFLPDYVIGYSSGENELLSLPFIKSRLLHLDEYREATRNPVRTYKEPGNSLVYIDSDMSQAVLLACLLFENEKTLEPLSTVENTGIQEIRRFSIYLTYQQFDFQKGTPNNVLEILQGSFEEEGKTIPRQIEKLKKCATSWYADDNGMSLDFFVSKATKEAFRQHFSNAFELFQTFQMLYELNNHFIEKTVVEDVYRSKGKYTDWKIPVGAPVNDVFYFLDYYLIKQERISKNFFDLLLRDFSDGEHQFLHTIGICLMLKNKRTLLLLDEPETHFNPSWRAKFIKVLSDSIKASYQSDKINKYNIHLLKDILLTSHSPFIISDCMPDNVIMFKRNDQGDVYTKTAQEIGFNTYGASVDLVLQEIFGMSHSISEHALEEIRILLRKRNSQAIIEGAAKLGESYEKGFLYERIQELNSKKKKNKR